MDTFRSTMGYPNVLGMILAGGEGSRLHPLTKERAKPAVPFGGKYRIIDRKVRLMPGDRIGYNLEEDRKRFFVTDSGIVVLCQPSRSYLQ